MFDANRVKDEIIDWLKNWFKKNGPDSPAVIGISGGKDSTVAAALLVEALGADRVIGVMMPNGHQADLGDSRKVCELLDIQSYNCNIENIVREFRPFRPTPETAKQAQENLPPRVRMTLLYYISQNLNGRVCNTCNLSEDYLGYSTRWGDECGDFAPLRGLTCTEVMKVGDALGLPKELVHKTPSDGLCGQTDEDRFGFSYKELDMMLRLPNFKFSYARSLPEKTVSAINKWHENSEFKRRPIEQYMPKIGKPYRLGLVLGRFQPVHNGHVFMIKEAMKLCDKVLILIGSAQEHGTYNNPFTYETRGRMIMEALEYPKGLAGVAGIKDVGLGNNARWGDYILEMMQKNYGELPDAFITGEETRRESWFSNKDIDVIVVSKAKNQLSATQIREKIYAGDADGLDDAIPHIVFKYISEYNIAGNPPKQKETKSI